MAEICSVLQALAGSCREPTMSQESETKNFFASRATAGTFGEVEVPVWLLFDNNWR
jgi:hypothetical protein